MRAILGIDHLTSGRALVGGRPFHEHHRPLTVVGALLTPDSVHPRRTARGHLSVVAASNGLPATSVDRMLHLVGIGDLADLPTGQMSLGMRQRLGLAVALIGDPAVVLLDEPHNGLDAGAIRWLRVVLRELADSGRTVLVSTHLMSEVELVGDDVVVIDQGRIVAASELGDFVDVKPGVRHLPGMEARYLELLDEP